ncbi:hypothetical protein AB1N83_003971 [Pleurotus pulmonarius]
MTTTIRREGSLDIPYAYRTTVRYGTVLLLVTTWVPHEPARILSPKLASEEKLHADCGVHKYCHFSLGHRADICAT